MALTKVKAGNIILTTTGEWHKSIKAIKDANPKPS